jgi:hypothetical protein
MGRLGWCLPLLVVLAACGSSGSGGKASRSTTTTAPPSVSGLRGVAVQALTCPAHVVSQGATPAPIGTPRTFLLCALEMPGQSSKNVTVAAGRPAFDSLVSALSRPDEPAPGPGTVCAAYADLAQVVLAQTSIGVYQVSIPVDGCAHYERAALAALQAARAAG